MSRYYRIIKIQDNFNLAFNIVAILAAFLAFGYFFTYKILLKGERRLSKQRVFIWLCFIGYLVMVVGVTFLNRRSGTWGSETYGGLNLHFLSSYKEAWNSFSLASWKFIILNIFMLVPLGILLPLLSKKFRKLKWVGSFALLMTLSIETLQLITGRGRFILDDLFNNTLGALIGYGIIMVIIIIFENSENKLKKSIVYLIPLILVITLSITIIGMYRSKEYGNLSIAYNYKINMDNINLSLNPEIASEIQKVFPTNRKHHLIKAAVFKIPVYDEEIGKRIFKAILQDKNIDKEIDIYNNKVMYWSRGESTHSMLFYYEGGIYEYSDSSYLTEGRDEADKDEKTVIKELAELNILVPKSAFFNKKAHRTEEYIYKMTIDNYVEGDYIINGNIIVEYYNSDTIKNINNNIIKYKKIGDIPIKSKREAYEDLREGKFNNYGLDQIEKIEVEDINLSYFLDSKGFYRPIYNFKSKINGKDGNILIPAS